MRGGPRMTPERYQALPQKIQARDTTATRRALPAGRAFCHTQVYDGAADARWALGATTPPPGHRARARAPLAAPARPTLWQVVKAYRRRRLVRIRHRVISGTLEAVKHMLASQGWQINIALIERLNLTIR